MKNSSLLPKSPDIPQRAVLQILSSDNSLLVSIPHISKAHNLIYPFLSVEVDIESVIINIKDRLRAIRKASAHSVAGAIDETSISPHPIILTQLVEIGKAIYGDSNIRGAFDYLLVHRDQIQNIRIVTNIRDDQIPWDLAYFENKGQSDGTFLCEIFSCGISMLDPENSLIKGPAAFQANNDVKTDEIFLIYGHNGGVDPRYHKPLRYLEDDCRIIENLANKYFTDPMGNPAQVMNLANKPRSEFLKLWERVHDKCRILYLQGHFDDGKLYTPQGPIDASIIIQWMGKDTDGLDSQPIVFLNGCTSALGQKREHSENSNMSLAKALINVGASACIMTRGPVYEGAASQFAQIVFYNLLVHKISLGDSIKLARHEVGAINDSVWSTSRLLYTLYGDPDQRLWYSSPSVPKIHKKSISILHSLTEVDAASYYESEDFDPWNNFDVIESTLSHIFRFRSLALSNNNFSQALMKWLEAKSIQYESIVEIGAGLGHISYNWIEARKDINRPLSYYNIIDISKNLINVIAELTSSLDATVIFNQRDARSLPFEDFTVKDLVVSIGMIADLYSIRINEYTGQPVKQLDHPYIGSYIKFLEDKGAILKGNNNSYYLHVGAFDFIRELARVMASGNYALIGEYRYSNINAIANFGNHQECGIRFNDIKIIAEYYGFKVEEYDMSEVLGMDISTKFLTMDFFTQYDLFDYLIPSLDIIHKFGNSLPVRGYTLPELEQELSLPKYKLREKQISKLLSSLAPYFYYIDDAAFDSMHPDTWHYTFLLLKKL